MKKKHENIDLVHEHTVPDVIVAAEQQGKKKRHIFAKLVCVLIATCVWLYVTSQDATDHEREFTDFAVTIDGITQLKANHNMSVISGYENTVDVIISGKKADVQDLAAEDIRVSLDISTIEKAGKYTLPVTVEVPEGFTVVNADQLTAYVYVDVNTEREVPVKIRNLDHIVSSSYTMGTPVVSMDFVKVTGPAQVLDLIDCAALDFDLGNVTTSITVVGTPNLVDADGVSISNPYVRCATSEISVEISVSTTKELKLVASYAVPELRGGWTAEVIPTSVTVKGDPALLATLDEIVVYRVPLNAVEGEYIVGVGVIDLPRGVTVENIPENITVRLHRING